MTPVEHGDSGHSYHNTATKTILQCDIGEIISQTYFDSLG